MRTIAVFFISLLVAGVARAQESKYFSVDSTRERLVVVRPLNERDISPEKLELKGDYKHDTRDDQKWRKTMDELCLKVFRDLPVDYKEFLHGAFAVVAFNKEGDIGNETLFIPRKRFQEIFAYEELLHQYILELRKINMLPYVDLNPAYFSTAVRRIKLYE